MLNETPSAPGASDLLLGILQRVLWVVGAAGRRGWGALTPLERPGGPISRTLVFGNSHLDNRRFACGKFHHDRIFMSKIEKSSKRSVIEFSFRFTLFG